MFRSTRPRWAGNYGRQDLKRSWYTAAQLIDPSICAAPISAANWIHHRGMGFSAIHPPRDSR
jgi:hypothetical protein